jgi:hypothetical protein
MPSLTTARSNVSSASAMIWGVGRRQVAGRAAVIVGIEHAVSEGCLVQSLLDQAESIASLGRVWRRLRGSRTGHLAEGYRARSPRASQSTTKVGMMA